MGQLRAGVARVNITPYVGINMSGFGNRTKESTGIHDDLYARAMALDDGSTKVGIVSCDLLNLDENSIASIRNKVQASTEMNGENVFISATHTHSGPLTSPLRGFGKLDREWVNVLEKKIAGAVRMANDNLQDARIGAGSGHAEINVNRRERRDKRTVIGLNPGGAIDYEVGVIKIDDAGGNPICIMVNYACHPVILGGDNYLISADYPGYAIGLVEKILGGDVTAMFLNGTTGNLNPLNRGTFEWAERLGNILGAEVVKVCQRIDTTSDVEIRMAKEKVELVSSELPPESELAAIIQKRKEQLGDSYNPDREIYLNWAEDALDMVRKGKKSAVVPVEVQVLRMGDIALAGIPGEVFVEIGLEIKKKSPFQHTYAVAHTNGCIGYMPTREAFQEGGYETHTAYKLYGIYPMDQDVAEKMINSSLKLMDRIR